MKFNVCNLPKCCHGCPRLSLINLDQHFVGEFECKSHDASLLGAYLTGECPYSQKISTKIKVEVKKMNPVELLKEAYRFCSQYPVCSADCPLRRKCIFDFCSHDGTQKETEQIIENAVSIIEKWSKDHPVVTNEMKFKEVFGPLTLSEPMFYAEAGWWNAPYKEPEHED